MKERRKERKKENRKKKKKFCEEEFSKVIQLNPKET
jgi:hypothetical protein